MKVPLDLKFQCRKSAVEVLKMAVNLRYRAKGAGFFVPMNQPVQVFCQSGQIEVAKAFHFHPQTFDGIALFFLAAEQAPGQQLVVKVDFFRYAGDI